MQPFVRSDQSERRSQQKVAAEQIDRLERIAADTQEELTQKNSELHAVVCASPAAIVLTGAHGGVREWNPAAERMLGYSRDEALDKSPELFLDPLHRRELD